MCRTCDSQSKEGQQSRDMIQGHPIGMAPMPVPRTLGKQDAPMAPITPSLCNQMLQQPPTLPKAPWHFGQWGPLGGAAHPKGRQWVLSSLSDSSSQHRMPEVTAHLCCFRG